MKLANASLRPQLQALGLSRCPCHAWLLHLQALAMNYITQVAIAKNDYEKATCIKKLSKNSGLIELCSIDW